MNTTANNKCKEKKMGRGTEPLNIDKIHEMVEYACEDITGVFIITGRK